VKAKGVLSLWAQRALKSGDDQPHAERKNVAHNVLNAKQQSAEADVILNAGLPA